MASATALAIMDSTVIAVELKICCVSAPYILRSEYRQAEAGRIDSDAKLTKKERFRKLRQALRFFLWDKQLRNPFPYHFPRPSAGLNFTALRAAIVIFSFV